MSRWSDTRPHPDLPKRPEEEPARQRWHEYRPRRPVYGSAIVGITRLMGVTLGLPERVRACLFDLDGVLTDTASVHTQSLEGDVRRVSCARRAERTGDKFVPFDSGRGLPDSMWTARSEKTVSGRSWTAAASSCPTATPTTTRRRDDARPRQPEERPVPGDAATPTGSRCSTDRAATSRPSTPPAWRWRWCRRAPTPARCSRSPVSTKFVQVARRRRHAARRRHRGQARAGLVPARRATARRFARMTRRCSRTRSPAWPPAVPATSGWWSASTESVTQRRCGATAPTSWCPIWRSCCDCLMIDRRQPSRSSRGSPGDQLRPGRARPDRIAVRPVQRPHRTARQPRRGRAPRPAGHLPERVLRDRGRCPMPRRASATRRTARPIVDVTNGKILRLLVEDEPFDVRYGELLHPRKGSRPARRAR